MTCIFINFIDKTLIDICLFACAFYLKRSVIFSLWWFCIIKVPLFHGSHVLEKAATRTSWFLGRTGKHLFLTDGKDGKPPLLLQMASDCEDLKFM